MNIKIRLEQFIKAMRLSKRQFQDSIGVSGSYVANINQGIGGAVLARIESTYPSLNIDWLLSGEGEMIKESTSKKTATDLNRVLVLPIAAQAGSLSQFSQSVEAKDCEYMKSPIDGIDYALTISGDSMEPEYPSGSKIFVKRVNESAFIDWGRVYVLDTCNGAIIKKVFPCESEGFVKCVSINPNYPSFEVNTKDIYGWYRVLGQFTLR